MLLIPAIDLRGGHCVRLYQGDYDVETRYDIEPQQLLERYHSFGARHAHIVDLDGAREGSQANRAAILRLTGLGTVRLQVGGGVRDAATVRTLLTAGVCKVVVGSAAVTDTAQVSGWMEEFGAERIVLAFDVRLDAQGTPHCAIHGWREQSRLSLWQAVEQYLPAGLTHVLCTDVSRDGALSGPNLDLYKECLRRYPDLRWQASGGIRDASDLTALADTGVAAAISGRALLEQRLKPEELRPFL